ncbi:MAG: ABC transporter ATP-binding protein [Clostridia bacterium]
MNVVDMNGIVKQYPLVRAVDNVTFSLKKGEIHSLLGENGAGKSTLMKILYGMCKPDQGEILINGEKVQIRNPRQAIELGIGMVHQHFMLTPVMTVAENVVLGMEPGKGIFFDYKTAVLKVNEMIQKYSLNISASDKVEELSVGEQQRVEILKAVYRGADILILDEPTAVLTPQEVEELFKIMRDLKSTGKSIIIITHKLKETMDIADRISVLRDGTMIESGMTIENVTTCDLAKLMVGRDVELGIVRRSENIGDKSFEIKNLSLHHKGKSILSDINLTLHKGEILGIAGVEGNGQSEFIEMLTGLRTSDTMSLLKDGREINGGARVFIENKIGHIPEDRMTRGLVMEMSVADNIILGYHKKELFARKGIFKSSKVIEYAEQKAEEYNVKVPNVFEKCSGLSGGNQQKIVIARVLSQDPDVIIVAQPTRGVDIGATEYIHNRLLDLRDEGKAIILISADLDEVRCLSDRIAVMYEGRIVVQAYPDEVDEVQLGLYMTGSINGRGGN